MTENKDYLGSLAKGISNKPDSFKEEKVERIQKSGPRFNFKIIIGVVVALIVVVVGGYFIFFAPKISMPNFVGKTSTDVATWAKQNEIANTNITMNKEYSLEVDENVIISQGTDSGKKINKDTKLNFVVSEGADPNELVAFPDIKNLTLEELTEWKAKNKLNKTKINVVFDDKIEKDHVISFDLKNVTENNFTRGTNLTIQVSKGPQPAGQVTVEDFVNKTYVEMETWAKSKKITLEKTEVYNDTIVIGNVVSQSAKITDTVKQGDVIQVSVSKGKAVKVVDFSTYDKSMFDAWNITNGLTPITKEIYYVDGNGDGRLGRIIRQSLKAGSLVDKGMAIEITYSLGRPYFTDKDIISKSTLEGWKNEVNSKGANIKLVSNEAYSTKAKGSIIKVEIYTANQKMDLNTTISFTYSKGQQYLVGTDMKLAPGATEAEAKKACESLNCVFEYTAETGTGVVKSAKQNGIEIQNDSYVNDSDLITVTLQ